MRIPRVCSLLVCISLFVAPLGAQSTPTQPAPTPPIRDPQAVATLEASIKAMGSTLPADSTATGALTIVQGSYQDTGTIQIQTRSTDQYSESLQLSGGNRSVMYSRLHAAETPNPVPSATQLPIAMVLSSQCPEFPLALLTAADTSSDYSIRYVGPESLSGESVIHIQLTNSFFSTPSMSALTVYTNKDVWIDANSNLVAKISYTRRIARGAPQIPLEIVYSNYQNISGVQYPFSIQKSFNGTPWQTITIQSVVFNTGLGDANFQVQ